MIRAKATGSTSRRNIASVDARRGDARGGLAPESIELVEIRTGVELRIRDARDHQRGNREVGIGTQRDVRETLRSEFCRRPRAERMQHRRSRLARRRYECRQNRTPNDRRNRTRRGVGEAVHGVPKAGP